MKGMMVPLLVLMMTGMVVGQQPSNPADSNQKIGRFLLDMTDEWINNLIENGSLRAPIQANARNQISQIDIRYKNSLGSDLEPAQILQVPSTDERALHFELTDNDLQILKQKGLRYTLRAQDRGKYDVVIIDYKAPAGFIGPRNQPQPINPSYDRLANRNNSNSGTGNDAFNRRPFSSTRNDDRRRDSNSLDNNFGNFGTRRQTTDNRPLSPSTSNNASNTNNQIESDFDRWARQQREKREAEELAAQQEADRIAAQKRAADQREANRLAAERLAAERLAAENRTRQIQQEDWRNRRLQDDQFATNSDVRPVDLQRLKDKMALEAAQRDKDEIDNLKYQAEQLKRQRLANERQAVEDEIDRELRLKQIQDEKERQEAIRRRIAMRDADEYPYIYREDRRPLIDPRTNRFPDRRPEDYEYAIDDDPDYDRLARNTTPVARKPQGSGPATFSISGPENRVANNTVTNANKSNTDKVVLADQTQLTRLNQQNKLLWFMLLCSLGLNVYLGWIARSFYGRYEELADELRETFTSTV